MDNGTLCVIIMSMSLLVCKVVNRITHKNWNDEFFALGIIIYLIMSFIIKIGGIKWLSF